MKVQDLIPYLISAFSLGWGVWQFMLNQKSKRRELKYKVYATISDTINLFQFELDKFLLSLKVNDLDSVKFSMSSYRTLKNGFEYNINIIKSSLYLISDQIIFVDKQSTDSNINNAEEKLESLMKHANGLESLRIQLEELTIEKEKIDLSLDFVENELNDVINNKREDFFTLNEKLSDFILNFTRPSEIELVSSDKVLQRMSDLKRSSINLKVFSDELIKNDFDLKNIFQFFDSTELEKFKESKSELLKQMKKEI